MVTAPVVLTDDGRQVIRQESGTYFAKYRDHDGHVRVVPTGCRDEANARQFLADLARRLRQHVAGRGPNEPVFTLPADILRRFKGDCKRAGIPCKDERGRKVDIHALWMSFIDRLVKSGIAPRIVQELARHSDISITMRHYTDLPVTDLHAAIGAVFVAPSVAPTWCNERQEQRTPVNRPAPKPPDR
jgi:site-specific recombinase XerD